MSLSDAGITTNAELLLLFRLKGGKAKWSQPPEMNGTKNHVSGAGSASHDRWGNDSEDISEKNSDGEVNLNEDCKLEDREWQADPTSGTCNTIKTTEPSLRLR